MYQQFSTGGFSDPQGPCVQDGPPQRRGSPKATRRCSHLRLFSSVQLSRAVNQLVRKCVLHTEKDREDLLMAKGRSPVEASIRLTLA